MSVYIKNQVFTETNSTYTSLTNSAIPGFNSLKYTLIFHTTVSYWASSQTKISFIYDDNKEYTPTGIGLVSDDELDIEFTGTLPSNIQDLKSIYVKIQIGLAEDLSTGDYQTTSFKLAVDNVPNYFTPKIYMRPNPDATLTYNALTIQYWGIGFNDTFGKTNNTFTFQYRYRTTSGSFGSWYTVTGATWDGNSYSGVFRISAINSDASSNYIIEVKITDQLASSTDSGEGTDNDAMFSWSPNGFDFNIPVNMHIGLDLDASAGFTMNGAQVLNNYGGSFSVGSSSLETNISGSNINCSTDGSFNINGTDIIAMNEQAQYIPLIKDIFSTTYQLTVPGVVGSSATATAYLRGNNLIVKTNGGAAEGSVQIRHYGKILAPDITLDPYDILDDYVYTISSSGSVYKMAYSQMTGNDIYFDITGPGQTSDDLVFVYPVALNLDATW